MPCALWPRRDTRLFLLVSLWLFYTALAVAAVVVFLGFGLTFRRLLKGDAGALQQAAVMPRPFHFSLLSFAPVSAGTMIGIEWMLLVGRI